MNPIKNQKPSSLKSLLVSGIAFGCGLYLATAEETQREWASEDGKYTVEASLVSYNPVTGKVTLKKSDSTSFEVLLSKLSSGDRAFVKKSAPHVSRANETDEAVKLYGITWQPEIKDALHLAKGVSSEQPVMWFRVLGKLDDGM